MNRRKIASILLVGVSLFTILVATNSSTHDSQTTPKVSSPSSSLTSQLSKQNTLKKITCENHQVRYKTTYLNASWLNKGTYQTLISGVNGKTRVCTDNLGNVVSSTVKVSPHPAVIYKGTYITSNSYSGYYNVDGNYVPSPNFSGNAINGYSPTAVCRDGSYSYSQHASGTCSYHGGVSYWLR